jgi:SAM-dependent methyltransferase
MNQPDRAIELQRAYYRDTAARYDGMHEVAEHGIALEHIVGYLERLDARSVLDTGCGTGLGMRHIANAMPMVDVRGNDASPDLLRVASELHGISPEQLDLADSAELPYDDNAFDAVLATGLMHHVPEPDKVVAEMLRVARQAVFISDVNRFGIGRLPVRLARLGLARTGLWAPLNRLRLGGKSWHFSEEDGVAWSYSVFDSRPALTLACAEVLMIPTMPPRLRSMALARLQCSHLLLCGFRRPLTDIAPVS